MKQFYSRQFILAMAITLLLSSCSEQEEVAPSAQIVKFKATDNYQAPEEALHDQVNPAFTSSINFTNTTGVAVADDFTVSEGESWSIKQVNAFFITDADSPLMNVFIYRDDAGQVGNLIYSSLNIKAEIVDEFPGGFTTVKTYQLDIADVRPGSGSYWIAFKQVNPEPSYTFWYSNFHSGNPFRYAIDNGEWEPFFEPLSLSFSLLGDSGATIGEVIQTLETLISAGTIIGVGRGKSAESRLQAFLNILVSTQALIDQGMIAEACAQLADAQKRIQTEETSTDKFITGDGAAELYDLITDVRDNLRCN